MSNTIDTELCYKWILVLPTYASAGGLYVG